jgi:uncharacterized peroxidase-related enzyme
MPHVPLSPDLPGITGALAFKPALGRKFSEFAEELMRGPSSLTPGERELIATAVSAGNQCYFCTHSHAATARHTLAAEAGPSSGEGLVDAVCENVETAPLTERMRALLAIAEKVRVGGRGVTEADVQRAHDAGVDDEGVHDTVFVAAAFCMANRYVDGLDTVAPRDEAMYDNAGRRLAEDGYLPLGR